MFAGFGKRTTDIATGEVVYGAVGPIFIKAEDGAKFAISAIEGVSPALAGDPHNWAVT